MATLLTANSASFNEDNLIFHVFKCKVLAFKQFRTLEDTPCCP